MEDETFLRSGSSALSVCAAQLGKLQTDMEALREQRESTICNTREELYSAQEEVPSISDSLTLKKLLNL